MEMVEENIDEGQKIDLYYHGDQVNAIRERKIYIHIRKTRVKKAIQTKTKCLALSIFSFVFGDEIGKHSSLSKNKPINKTPHIRFLSSNLIQMSQY
jgi:hypothetical protein